MNWIAEAVVIFVTGMVVMGGPAWWMGRASKRVPVGRLADPAPLPGELPRAGRLPYDLGQHSTHAHAAFAGALDPSYEVSAPVPWDLAGAAYALGQQRAAQDEVADQMAVLIAEMRAAEWRGEG